jgi:RHS repeat-associated protein
MADKIPASPTAQQLRSIQITGLVLVHPAAAKAKASENSKAAAAVKKYINRAIPTDASALRDFLKADPRNPWTHGLRITLGIHCYQEGRFSEALSLFETAWTALKSSPAPDVRNASVEAAAELAGLYARLGRAEELRVLLDEVRTRPISGSATEKLRMAAEGLASMDQFPEHSFKCGPFALRTVRETLGLEPFTHPLIEKKQSERVGISLLEVEKLAQDMGMDWVAVTRKAGAPLPVPAVVHWKVGHYAAVVQRTQDGRLLVRDPTFLQDFLMDPAVFDQESSGSFLLPSKALGGGIERMTPEAASQIRGKGAPTSKDPDDGSCPVKCGTGSCKGMAAYSFNLFKAGLIINDTPVGYTPPFGPSVAFQFTYTQRTEQSFDQGSASLGPKWTMNWLSYIQQQNPAGDAVLFNLDGSRETHQAMPPPPPPPPGSPPTVPGPPIFYRQSRSHSKLEQVMRLGGYVLTNPDGSVYVYGRLVNSGGLPKAMLSQIRDPQGNTLTFTYDASGRLTGITDALGQTSSLFYENAQFPNRVTKISDPFGAGGSRRSALMSYDTSGRLVSITDPEGIQSSFTYHPTQPDFITSLTTPYGKTEFATEPPLSGSTQFVEVTDPLGRKERVEYRHSFQNILPGSDPEDELPDPALIQTKNNYLYYGNTLHWDKKTYAHHPPDPVTGANYDKAVRHKWMWHQTVAYRPIGVISSIKKPLESRVWYNYPGQVLGTWGIAIGSSESPSRIGRRTDSGQSQVTLYEHNDLGLPTSETDPLGRVTTRSYDGDGNLLSVRRQSGSGSETLESYTYRAGDPPRQARTRTDAAGQVTTYAWNSRGQLLSVTDPAGNVTTNQYNAAGYLAGVDGPLPGASDIIHHTYDAFGRVRTTTQPGGYTVTRDYDALDRPTLVTYPDGTTEQFAYARGGVKLLDRTHQKDRDNRWTRSFYNALRERVVTVDPLQRRTVFNWCYCGSLQDLYDAAGNRTHWDWDIGGRLIAKQFADGTTQTYTYDLAGRLTRFTDAENQTRLTRYDADNRVAEVSYLNARLATPTVSFKYDAVHGRVTEMTDGSGVTTYGYHPAGGLGAGRLAAVDGPLADDTLSYTYDALGRVLSRSIHGAANRVAIENYDAAGRVTAQVNPLGRFEFGYNAEHLQLETVTAPNGMVSRYEYQPANRDLRLGRIAHGPAVGTALAWHEYAYSAGGEITAWSRGGAGRDSELWALEHDKAGQLVSASRPEGPQEAWSYDLAGNRLSQQSGAGVSRGVFNGLNQLLRSEGGGQALFSGRTDEPAVVRVQSNETPEVKAEPRPDNGFRAWVPVEPGKNTVRITAQDGRQNTKTQSYELTVPAVAPRVFTYDANGNTLSDGLRSYEWDAENRLARVRHGDGSVTAFGYDGRGRRVLVEEKDAQGTATSVRRYVWADGAQPAEERDGANAVLRRFYGEGEQVPGAVGSSNRLFYAKDHLGSVREVTDAAGVLRARYDYDFWGNRTRVSGDVETAVGYTGHHHHGKSGLVLTWYRAYDPDTGRWLSRDPIGEKGGLNLYGYVENSPVEHEDPYGESAVGAVLPWAGGAAVADGPLPVGDILAGAILAGAAAWDLLDWVNSKGRYTCTATCNVQKINPKACCPDRTIGQGGGKTMAAAERAALRDAQMAGRGLNGCYVRHCHIMKCWRN